MSNKDEKKKLSIITVCFNEKEGIEKTCKSVADQVFKNFEWIVVDGGSTDGTLDILNKYKNRIKFLISEKDNGVYDAMNKGIRLASGEYLLFLNGGDYLYNSQVLENVFVRNSYQEDILYGNCCVISEDGKKQILDFSSDLNKKYLLEVCINHQSTFIKKYLFDKYGFYDTSYKIIADYEKWLCFISKKVVFKKIPWVISCFNFFGGLSSNEKNKKIIEEERKRAIGKYFNFYELAYLRFNFFQNKFVSFLRQPAKKVWCWLRGKKLK